MKKRVIIGLFAHVDAGKTTLAERLLYMNGTIRNLGRVDNGDTFLDTGSFERERGITMFSKQARFEYKDTEYILVDTPGHSDLTPETERAMWTADCALVIISASEGVTSHTKRLWTLLESYGIPVFLFVNKTDMPGISRGELINEIKEKLSSSCAVYGGDDEEGFFEEAALSDEKLLESFLDGVRPSDGAVRRLVEKRELFPCCFGSALTGEGTDGLMKCLSLYHPEPVYGDDFSAVFYKVSRDAKGSRLLWMKITGGRLKVKDIIKDGEKADEIRIYNGENYVQAAEAESGDICAVKGVSGYGAGDTAGSVRKHLTLKTVPVLSYDAVCDDPLREKELINALRVISEEETVIADEKEEGGSHVSVRVTGKIQLEVLKRTLSERFGLNVSFKEQDIVYKETIADRVTGVGHFEPLKHYAEVHVLLEPAEKGSGVIIENMCSRDDLEPHWQKLIISHLSGKRFKGVLTGSELTDIRITLLRGKAHEKHTDSGDFRQAAFRAVRQGLMEAESILLEPVFRFSLEVPENNAGRALSDLVSFGAQTEIPVTENRTTVISGSCPAVSIRNYQGDVASYTSGQGTLTLEFGGYAPCRNASEVIARKGYDPESDTEEPSSSVFCSHGSGLIVPWYEVRERMHLEDVYEFDEGSYEDDDYYEKMPALNIKNEGELSFGEREALFAAGELELKEIFSRTYRKKEGRRPRYRKKKADVSELSRSGKDSANKRKTVREEMLIVDGYNMIFAWDELRKLAHDNIDSARDSLMDILSDYQGTRAGELILVFDAYKVPGMKGEKSVYHNIEVVYTKEGETADKYIERTVNEKGRTRSIRVATSDALEQTIVLGNGAARMPALELWDEISKTRGELKKKYQPDIIRDRVNMLDDISEELKNKLDGLKE